MYSILKKISLLLIIFSFSFLTVTTIFSTDIDNDISKIEEQIAALEKAMAPLKGESTDLSKKINQAKSQINSLTSNIKLLNQKLIEKEVDLEVQKILLGERVKRYYKNSKKFSPLVIFFAQGSQGSSLLQEYTWYQSIINKDKDIIVQYGVDIKSLSDNKVKLEVEQGKLDKLKKDLESRFGFLAGEIKKAETYKNQLSQELKNLEAKRISSLNLPTSVGSGLSCVDDRTIDPGFGTGFAFFTFGIPHHVGLNQYGAYGRANAGQNYRDILNAYYNNVSIEKRPNITLQVEGHGSMSLEQYLLGIYEVPGSWPIEALKAQVLAARSYALAYTNNGANQICTTQACQVYKGGNKGGNWERAVRETEGEVLVQNGQVITAWYASTAGGYTYTSSDIGWKSTGWTKRLRDTNGDINSFDDLFNKAYDKDSPCFYSAQGWRTEYNKSAWLKPNEVADIVNAIMLGQKDSSTQKYLCQPDIAGGRCKMGSEYYNVWNTDKVKEELRNRGGTPYNSINSASVSWDKGSGQTTQISLSGDVGSVNFDGSTFKTYFNSRAPANIAIVGKLYNVERR